MTNTLKCIHSSVQEAINIKNWQVASYDIKWQRQRNSGWEYEQQEKTGTMMADWMFTLILARLSKYKSGITSVGDPSTNNTTQ